MTIFKRSKSLSELEEENEKQEEQDRNLSTELSIAQKKVAIAELKKRGLTPKHFGMDFSKIIEWLKSH